MTPLSPADAGLRVSSGGHVLRNRVYHCDALRLLKALPSGSVNCIVTSPPYFGLRDYGVDGQIGLEETPAAFIAALVAIFREAKRVLRDDGVMFVNMGDSYFGSSMTGGTNSKEGSAKRSGRMFKKIAYGEDAQAYDSDDTKEQGYQDRDLSSENLYDEHTGSWLSRIPDTDCRHAHVQAAELYSQIQARMAELTAHLPIADYSHQPEIAQSLTAILDQVQIAIRVAEQLLSFPVSTIDGFSPQPPGGLTRTVLISAFLSALRSFSVYAHQFVRKSSASLDVQHGNLDTASLCAELVDHIQCTSGYCSLVVSWLNLPYIQPHCTTFNLKPKDLMGIPWRLAFALQDDGWILRQEIIWAKRNPMPESVRDRCTKSHEQVFMFSKSPKYFYDADSIREGVAESGVVQETDFNNQGLVFRQDTFLKIPASESSIPTPLVFAESPGDFLKVSVGIASTILNVTQSQDDFGLLSLYPQIGHEFRNELTRLFVANAPIIRRASTQATRFANGDISPKHFLCEMYRLWITLPDSNQLKEAWRIAFGGITFVNSDSNATIGINHARQVGQVNNALIDHSENSFLFSEQYTTEHTSSPGRNKRSVWFLSTEPNSFAHFATFPQALITPMILAGCPDKTCAVCGAPWVRVVERQSTYTGERSSPDVYTGKAYGSRPQSAVKGHKKNLGGDPLPSVTLGFEPTCTCNGATRPGLTLDPFFGSGTTGLVARKLGRDWMGSELNSDYVAIARERLRKPYEQHYIERESAPLEDLPLFAPAVSE